MSVLIKGMEMPDSCWNCPFDKPLCTLWQGMTTDEMNNGRHKDCPLVPVPPHGDLIDRDPFIEFIKTHLDGYDQWVVGQLEARPTIIPAEEGET